MTLEKIYVTPSQHMALTQLLASPRHHVEAQRKHLIRLIQKYGLNETPSHNSNAMASYKGNIGDVNIFISVFNDFFTVEVIFGEVRHLWSNHTTLGEHGGAYASSAYQDGKPRASADGIVSGGSIEGNDLEGVKYRLSMSAPKSRQGFLDRYIKSEDIIEVMMGFRYAIPTYGLKPTPGVNWDDATIGW